jgi:hypothetical protein
LFCTPAFFRAQPGGEAGILPAHRHWPLAELTLLPGSCPIPAEIRYYPGVMGAKQMLIDPGLTIEEESANFNAKGIPPSNHPIQPYPIQLASLGKR